MTQLSVHPVEHRASSQDDADVELNAVCVRLSEAFE